MTELSANYEIRRFDAASKGEPGYEQGVAWSRAVTFGFHEAARDDERIEKSMEAARSDRRTFTGVYRTDNPAPHSWPAEIPVATFGTLQKSLNIGYGRELDARLVTAVTVRTPHRRRGLLRRMMGEDLELARSEGLAIAALTASEGTIYRRFGFGVASFERTVSVDTTERFRLAGKPAGSVEVVDPKVLLDLGPRVFAKVHRLTPGSVARQEYYRLLASGSVGPDGKDDPAVKAALHYDQAGQVDGYVSYKFLGWDKKPYTMEIVDLVAATSEAYLGLWQYLASIDLVQRVTWPDAPVDDPLTWALEDPRCIESSEQRDMLWLRILDVPAALTARQYSAAGRLVLDIADGLGHAAGRWVLDAVDGNATVAAAAEGTAAELSLDVADLGSIYLGGVSPVTLLAAGRIKEHAPGAALRAQQMFAVERPVHCLTHF